MNDVSFGDGDGSIDPSSEENRMLHAPGSTERTYQRLRVSRPTAHLARKVEALPPGVRIVIVVGVRDDGERWWDVICTEQPQ